MFPVAVDEGVSWGCRPLGLALQHSQALSMSRGFLVLFCAPC